MSEEKNLEDINSMLVSFTKKKISKIINLSNFEEGPDKKHLLSIITGPPEDTIHIDDNGKAPGEYGEEFKITYRSLSTLINKVEFDEINELKNKKISAIRDQIESDDIRKLKDFLKESNNNI